jgi:hypothetical protein
MRKFFIALTLGAFALGTAAEAQTNVRQLNQSRRIDAGRRSGKLTAAEGARLRAEQRSIDAYSRRQRALHNGHLTEAAKREIHRRQAIANRHILRAKHNRARGRDHFHL